MKHKDDSNQKTTEYIYLNDDKKVIYSSRNKPLKYEDQTICIKVTTDNVVDMEMLLDCLNLK
tara:strand:+ start:996 stop:1181 length:186 start_codon:yes stop_codon:yes gene_type:complete